MRMLKQLAWAAVIGALIGLGVDWLKGVEVGPWSAFMGALTMVAMRAGLGLLFGEFEEGD